MPMHIAFIISSLTAGGAERVLTQLANHLAERDYRVSLITLAPPTAAPFYPLHNTINLIQLDLLMEVHSLPRRLCAILKRLWCIRKTIKQLNPDRIISFIDITNITTLIAAMGRSVPIIVSERIDPTHHSIPGFYKWLRLKFYPKAKAILVQTTASAAYFPQNIQPLIHIIPNAVTPSAYTHTVHDNENHTFHFVGVGRLTPQKDHETLIRAFARVLTEYGDGANTPTLTLYGEGYLRSRLKSLIQTLGLDHHITLPGTTVHLQEALAKADVFVFPSRYEGFPNALCEAMAAGLPVIASNCSGNVDVVRDGIDGVLFPVGDVDTLASLMTDVMTNAEKRQMLSDNACTISDRFETSTLMNQWEILIKTVS